ncbi:hypothetical protein Tco_1385374 [Tanacetum coccineum]
MCGELLSFSGQWLSSHDCNVKALRLGNTGKSEQKVVLCNTCVSYDLGDLIEFVILPSYCIAPAGSSPSHPVIPAKSVYDQIGNKAKADPTEAPRGGKKRVYELKRARRTKTNSEEKTMKLLNLLPTLLAQVGSQDSIREMVGIKMVMPSMTTSKAMLGMSFLYPLDGEDGVSLGYEWIHTRMREPAVGISWEDFKNLTRGEFYPVNEIQKLETEFWNYAMIGAGHVAYTDRFHELAREAGLSKYMAGPELPPELRRSWCIKGYIRSEVISYVLIHRYQRTIRQRYSPCEGPLSLE